MKKLKFYVLKYDHEFVVVRPSAGIKTLHVNPKNLPEIGSNEWKGCCSRLREIFGDETYSRKSFGESHEIQLIFNMEYKVEGFLWAKTEEEIAKEQAEGKDVYDWLNRVKVTQGSLIIPCTENDIRFFHSLMIGLKD